MSMSTLCFFARGGTVLTRLLTVYLDKPMVVKRRVVCRTLSTPTFDGSVTTTAHNAIFPGLFLKA